MIEGFQGELAYNAGPISAFASIWSAKNPTDSAGNALNTWLGNPQAGANAATAAAAAPSMLKQEAWRIGGSYNFGMAKVGLLIDDSSYTTTAGKRERTAWSLPVVVPMGAGQALFTYTKNGNQKLAGVTQTNTGASMVMLGYNYDLSKRTAVGVAAARISNQSAANYGMFVASSATLGENPQPSAGQNVTSVSLGMIHRF